MATGTFFFDSSGLADYLQGYPNSSIEYGDDYMFALTYHSMVTSEMLFEKDKLLMGYGRGWHRGL